jgi:hypothetical protein
LSLRIIEGLIVQPEYPLHKVIIPRCILKDLITELPIPTRFYQQFIVEYLYLFESLKVVCIDLSSQIGYFAGSNGKGHVVGQEAVAVWVLEVVEDAGGDGEVGDVLVEGFGFLVEGG